jgi:hypothetical protein
MKLKNCGIVNPSPWGGTCYRAITPQYVATALTTAHTSTISSRFSSGSIPHPQFEILYLAENPILAMFEVQAMLGSWHGVNVPNPQIFVTMLSVQVKLASIADLTTPANLKTIDTTIQELTGDWQGYALRNPIQPNRPPYFSDVPTQQLGFALDKVPGLEGFVTYSAKVPDRKNLVLFPKKLVPPSSVVYLDSAGNVVQKIP